MKYSKRIAIVFAAALCMSSIGIAGPVAQSGAAVTSSDHMFYGDLSVVQCANCTYILDVSTWSTTLPFPRTTSVVIKTPCTPAPDWRQHGVTNFALGGIYYAETEIDIASTPAPNCSGGTIAWRLGMVNTS